jgi:hypothetical protein
MSSGKLRSTSSCMLCSYNRTGVNAVRDHDHSAVETATRPTGRTSPPSPLSAVEDRDQISCLAEHCNYKATLASCLPRQLPLGQGHVEVNARNPSRFSFLDSLL